MHAIFPAYLIPFHLIPPIIFCGAYKLCYVGPLSTGFVSLFRVVDARRIIWSKFLAENPQFWSDPWTLPLFGAFCSAHVNWYTFVYLRKTAIIVEKILGATIQNLDPRATGPPGFVHPRFIEIFNQKSCISSFPLARLLSCHHSVKSFGEWRHSSTHF